MNAAALVDGFSQLHVLVLGDTMLDAYVRGRSTRLCQEAPVPIIDCEEEWSAPGGAANTAVNLRALGARVTLLSVVGDDDEGRHLCDLLARQEVDASAVVKHPARSTLTKRRILAGSQLVARLDAGVTQPLNLHAQRAMVTRLQTLHRRCDAIVLSDYDYGAIGEAVITALARLQQQRPVVLVGDSKCLSRFGELSFSAVKPNYEQALRLLHAGPAEGAARIDQMLELGPQLLERIVTQIAALTLDRDGAIVFHRGGPPLRTLTQPNPHSRAAGAGDTYVAALALALAAGGDAPEAAQIAAAAAAVVVGQDGTSHCSAAELRGRLAGLRRTDLGVETLLPTLEDHRRRGRRIVLTNGCFDILHRGHVTYLHQARALGDVLIVGVNSDASIRRLKGPQRPINSLEDRLQVLSALDCVDHVIAFDEDTPHRLVRAIRPHVFVKGGDYTRDRLPEAALVEELGGRIEILPLVRERSTTGLISRIRAADGESSPAPLPAISLAAGVS